MGGSSKSNSTSSNEQKDNRVILEGSGLVATDGSNIFYESLDVDIVNAALQAIKTTTGRSLDSVDLGAKLNTQNLGAILEFAQDSQKQSLRQVDNAVALVTRDNEARQFASGSEAERLIQTISQGNTRTMLIIGAAAALAFITLKK